MSEKRAAEEPPEQENGNCEKRAKIEPIPAGTLCFAGMVDYSKRKMKVTKGNPIPETSFRYSPIRFESTGDVKFTKVSSHPKSMFFLAITDDGKVWAWGSNEQGQLGLGHTKDTLNPALVKSIDQYEIAEVATGRTHSLFLTSDGKVLSSGNNEFGQCGQSSQKKNITEPQVVCLPETGMTIKQIACGGEFSIILSDDGRLFAFGHPLNGVLGQGVVNSRIEKAGQVLYDFEYSPVEITRFLEKEDGKPNMLGQPIIKQVMCGSEHCVAIDEDERLFTWGNGTYGRLGHNTVEDEDSPRLLKSWYRITGKADRGVTRILAVGGAFTMVETIVPKMVYMWGQFKLNDNANMYPKQVDDLMGWNTHFMCAGNMSWMGSCDDSVIASVPSPGMGQLGMGEKKKSSAKPVIVDPFKNIKVLGLGMGVHHTVWIVREDTDMDKMRVSKFVSEKI